MAKPFQSLKSPILDYDSQLTFGRHFGYTVEEVLKDRPEYIAWLLDNTSIKFSPRVVELVDTLLPPTVVAYSKQSLIPKDISYWQRTDHWHDDIPF